MILHIRIAKFLISPIPTESCFAKLPKLPAIRCPRLDPASQGVSWLIRFVENMITSRQIFSPTYVLHTDFLSLPTASTVRKEAVVVEFIHVLSCFLDYM